MTEQTIEIQSLIERNPLIDLWSLIRDIIHNEVIDPNTERAANSNPLATRWVFPENPENNDEKYPRATIKFYKFDTSPYAADDYIADLLDEDDNEKGTIKGRLLRIPVLIGVFIKKQQGYEIELPNNEIKYMKDTLLGDHLAWRIKQAILKNRTRFIEKRFDIVGDIETSPTYNDNAFLFATDINFTVEVLDIWENPISDGGLIAEFDLSMEAEYNE